MIEELRGVIDGGTGGRIRYKFNVEGPIGGKPEPPTVTQMPGLWASRPSW